MDAIPPDTKYLEKSKTLNSKVYKKIPVHVDVTIKFKHQIEFQYKKLIFHQNNSRQHVPAITGWTPYGFKWDLLPHSPYSPNVAPSDLYLFSCLQLHFDGAIFLAQDVGNEVDLFLDLRASSLWAEGF